MHAVPDAKSNPLKQNRLAIYGVDDPIAKMPDADNIVLSAFRSMRRARYNGMGREPISWQEIDAYCNRSGTNLTPWEASQVAQMSDIYCSYIATSTDNNAEPPYQRAYTDAEIKQRQQTELKLFDASFDM